MSSLSPSTAMGSPKAVVLIVNSNEAASAISNPGNTVYGFFTVFCRRSSAYKWAEFMPLALPSHELKLERLAYYDGFPILGHAFFSAEFNSKSEYRLFALQFWTVWWVYNGPGFH